MSTADGWPSPRGALSTSTGSPHALLPLPCYPQINGLFAQSYPGSFGAGDVIAVAKLARICLAQLHKIWDFCHNGEGDQIEGCGSPQHKQGNGGYLLLWENTWTTISQGFRMLLGNVLWFVLESNAAGCFGLPPLGCPGKERRSPISCCCYLLLFICIASSVYIVGGVCVRQRLS